MNKKIKDLKDLKDLDGVDMYLLLINPPFPGFEDENKEYGYSGCGKKRRWPFNSENYFYSKIFFNLEELNEEYNWLPYNEGEMSVYKVGSQLEVKRIVKEHVDVVRKTRFEAQDKEGEDGEY